MLKPEKDVTQLNSETKYGQPTEMRTFLQALKKGTAPSWKDKTESVCFQKPTNSGLRIGQGRKLERA